MQWLRVEFFRVSGFFETETYVSTIAPLCSYRLTSSRVPRFLLTLALLVLQDNEVLLYSVAGASYSRVDSMRSLETDTRIKSLSWTM